MRHLANVLLPALLLAPATLEAQTDPTALPLLRVESFEYVGAFRLPASTGSSSSDMNYSEGPLAVVPDSNSILIVGHSHDQEIAEFSIPALVRSDTLSHLNMAGSPIQNFSSSVLWRVSNPQGINRIGGLAVVPDGAGTRLLVNGYEYYDAPGDNWHTTLTVSDPRNIASSTVGGYLHFGGGAGHTSGWMSPVPPEWLDTLGGPWITGQSSGIPIISRTSVGPSAFVFDPSTVVDTMTSPIPTTKLLDFSLANPLAPGGDLGNSSGTNDIWTHLSRATYGFIVPGSRTYATFGYSGGHGPRGVCYKCTQDNGNLCGGYCAPDDDDYYQFLWMWDVNDLLAVKAGTMNSHDVQPYWHGEFPTPFEGGSHQIGGGSFDPVTGYLYLTIQRADREQGRYANPPVVVVYHVVPVVLARAKVMLEGAYDSASNSMRLELGTIIPTDQPFSEPEFDGTMLEHDEPVEVESIPAGTVDWVQVQLRSGDPAAPPMNLEALLTAFVRTDGWLVGADGDSVLAFPNTSPGSYHLAVLHRNHLGVMSSSALALDGTSTPLHDFTSSATASYGTDPSFEVEPGVWSLRAGDADIDREVDIGDFAIWIRQAKIGATGYLQPDFDLDGAVSISDFAIWLRNAKSAAAGSVPDAQ